MRAANPRTGTRRTGGGVIVAVLLATALALVASPSPASAADGEPIALGAFGNLAVDPVSGRVFVSGDDVVLAYAPDGTRLATLTGVTKAFGLAFAGGDLWVTQSVGALARFDVATLQRKADVPTGSLNGPLAAVDGKLWFTAPSPSGSKPTLKVLDPATGAVSARGTVAASRLEAVPGSPTRLLASGTVTTDLLDITADPVTVAAATPYLFESAANGSFAPTEVGTFAGTTPGPGSVFTEMSLTPDTGSVLRTTGVRHRTEGSPTGIAYSPGKGGQFAATSTYSKELAVFPRGVPTASHRIDLPARPMDRGVALSADGTRAYVVTQEWPVIGIALRAVPLTPTAASASVTSIPQGRSTTVTISGSGLGAITSVTLAGTSVPFATDRPDRLELEVRASVAPGAAAFQLQSPFGTLSVPVTIVANPSGTVRGTVTTGRARTAGATVRLTDATGASRTTTSAADGTYALTGVAAGRYDLAITKDAAHHAWRDQALDGSGPWVFELDLRAAPAATLERRRVDLPPGPVRRVVLDPTTDRTFVAVGDEVVAVDRDGRVLARIPRQWTASDLQVSGSTLYVMLADAATISVIDIASLAVTRTITIPRTTTGALVVAGGRATFTHDDHFQPLLASVDLTTGGITDHGPIDPPAVLAPVEGTSDQFVLGEEHSTTVRRYQVTGAALAERAVSGADPVNGASLDLVASGAAGRVWASGGDELTLSDLQPSGTPDPDPDHGGSAVARTAGHGGVVAYGRVLAKQGAARTSHTLPLEPARRAVALDAAGGRALAASEAGVLVVADLAPIANTVGPPPSIGVAGTATVTGMGLGAATKVTVDGRSVPFEVTDPEHLVLQLPAPTRSDNVVVVTTPWGTSSPRLLRATAGWDPFASWGDLVDQLYQALTAKAPTAANRSRWISQLTAGTARPGDLADALRRTPASTADVDPVARLYRAVLGRTADAEGLRFWIARKRAGTWTVTRMADHFAASSEFQQKYGALSNREFVERIYRDVLFRGEDPSGIAYWTGKLDRKERTRGQVMVGFSESAEYRRIAAAEVDATIAHVYLLGRSPTSLEVQRWRADRYAGTSSADLLAALLASPELAQRITG